MVRGERYKIPRSPYLDNDKNIKMVAGMHGGDYGIHGMKALRLSKENV